ncbi:kelch repeat-containing protein [Pirellulaceae bacterium SH449]
MTKRLLSSAMWLSKRLFRNAFLCLMSCSINVSDFSISSCNAQLAASGAPITGKPLVDWRELSPIPDLEGFAGVFAGASHDVLLVAGGANFPDKKPWEGGTKIWYDQIFALRNPSGAWETVGHLPRPLGYGVSISHAECVICIGGSDADRHYADTFRLKWIADSSSELRISFETLPSLPVTIANACGALVGDTIYVAGGQERPDSRTTLSDVWCLDLASDRPQWQAIEPLPGRGRMLSVAASLDGAFWLVGGVDLEQTMDDMIERVYLSDAFCYRPGIGWKQLPDLPGPVTAAPSPAPADESGIYLLGGDDGTQVGVPAAIHHGFSSQILHFDTNKSTWQTLGTLPAPRVTVPCVNWRHGEHGTHGWVIPSGEKQPGIRSPSVWLMTTETTKE